MYHGATDLYNVLVIIIVVFVEERERACELPAEEAIVVAVVVVVVDVVVMVVVMDVVVVVPLFLWLCIRFLSRCERCSLPGTRVTHKHTHAHVCSRDKLGPSQGHRTAPIVFQSWAGTHGSVHRSNLVIKNVRT